MSDPYQVLGVSRGATEEEIFCDDASRLDMMKRIFTGRIASLMIIFFLFIIPQLVSRTMFYTSANSILLTLLFVMFFIYLAIFLSFAVSFWKCYKTIHKK